MLCISAHTAAAAEQIRSFLKKKKDDLKLTGFDVLGVGVILFPALYFSVYEQIEKIFKTVADFLKSKNVAGGDTCPYCGAKMTEKRSFPTAVIVFTCTKRVLTRICNS